MYSDSRNIMNIIKEIEEKIPVKSWSIFGVNIWPSLRISIRPDLFSKMPKNNKNTILFNRRLRKHHVFFLFFKHFFKDFSFRLFLKKDVLFITDGASLDYIDNVWTDKFFRGIEETLINEHKKYIMFTPNPISKRNLKSNIISLEWLNVFAGILTSIYARLSPKIIPLKEYTTFIQILEKHNVPLDNFTEKNVFLRAFKIRILKFLLFPIIKMIRPKKIYTNSYYHDLGFAINSVAHKLNIPTIEIQHGSQAGIHDAYNQWTQVPKGGFKELPKVFWTWSKNDANEINCWAQQTNYHNALKTGNLSLERWIKGTNNSIRKIDTTINECKNQLGGTAKTVDILVSLQPVWEWQQYWNLLADIIQNTNLNVRWWLRQHPTTVASTKMDGLEKISSIQQNNVDFDTASSVPLGGLLRNVDLHITVRSSTALEAEQFGIKTIFLSELAAHDCASLMETGMGLIMEEPNDIIKYIEQTPKITH